MADLSPLRQRMIEDMKVRNLSPRRYIQKGMPTSRHPEIANKAG